MPLDAQPERTPNPYLALQILRAPMPSSSRTDPERPLRAGRRDPSTGRFVPSGSDGDARWERLFADRSRDAAVLALVARVEDDIRAGRTLELGWDEIDARIESDAAAPDAPSGD